MNTNHTEEDSKKLSVLLIAPADSIHTFRWVERLKKANQNIFVINTSRDSLIDSIPGLDSTSKKSGEDLCNHRKKLIKIVKYLVPQGVLFFAGIIKQHLKIKKIIKDSKIDVIHLHWVQTSTVYSLIGIKKIPILISPWGSDVLKTEKYMKLNIFEKILWHNRIFVASKIAAAAVSDGNNTLDIIKKFNNHLIFAHVIRFGINTEKFVRTSIFPEEIRDLGFKNSDFIIYSNRNLSQVYDVETLARAYLKVFKQLATSRMLIAGRGEREAKIEAILGEHLQAGRVVMLGEINEELNSRILSGVDLFISTSLSDGGVAQSVLEAMSSSVPLVLSDLTENKEILKMTESGLIFGAGDEESLAEQIVFAAKNHTALLSKAGEARSWIITNCESAVVTRQMLDRYHLLMGCHRSRKS